MHESMECAAGQTRQNVARTSGLYVTLCCSFASIIASFLLYRLRAGIPAVCTVGESGTVITADQTNLKAWDVSHNRITNTFRGHSTSVHSVAYLGRQPTLLAPTDQALEAGSGLGAVSGAGAGLIASGSSDCRVRVWNVATTGQVSLLEVHRARTLLISAIWLTALAMSHIRATPTQCTA